MTISGERLDAVVAEAVAGNRDALRQVLETIRPIVVRYCRARVGTAERSGLSADDVAQEVCLAAITALPRYKDQGRPFLAFVYGIAAHKVADAHRAAARNRSEPTDVVPERFSAEAGPEQMALEGEAAERMNRLLALLPALRKGTQGQWDDVRAFPTTEVTIRTRRRRAVNTDGELSTYTPAHFRIRPKAIRVFAPPVG